MNLTRTVTVTQRAAKGPDDNTIELAISSETPYERWFGIEILGHGEKEVDLTRINDGRHPLLINHDTDKQVGVIASAAIGKDNVLRGVARFSKSEDAQEILQDVRDGIRTLVSVGYMIDQIVEITVGEDGKAAERALSWPEFEAEQKALHGEHFYRAGPPAARAKGGEPPVYRVTRWTPFEASLVAVPADVTVGVGRAADAPQVQQQKAETPQETPPATPAVQPLQGARIIMEPTKPDPAKLEEARRNAIIALGEQYAKRVSDKETIEAVRGGWDVEKFKDFIMQKLESQHSDTSAAQLGLTKKEAQRYSFGNLIRALTLKQDDPRALEAVGFELECSRAMAGLLGRTPEGVYVPFDIMRRDFNVGTGTEAGNLVPNELRTDLYVDALRASMVMAGLGVRILTGLTSNVDIPRKATPSTLAGVTEIGSAAETNPLTDKLTLSPKRVSAYVEASKQAIIQSAIPLEAMLRDDLVTGAAIQIENYAIQGSSAANGTGIIYRSGLGTVAEQTNGTNLIWDHLVDMETAAANVNAEPDRLAGYLINSAIRGKAKKVQRGTNLDYIWEKGGMPLNGYRAPVTNNLPRNLTKGTSTTVASALAFSSDWSMLVLGFFGGVDVTVDPYTKSDSGQVKITLNQFWDYTVRQPGAFVVRKDILTA